MTEGEPVPPGQRRYMVPFEGVWRTLEALLRRSRRWTVVESDPVAGTIRAEVRSVVLRRRARALLRVSLDELGRTRVEVVFLTRSGAPARAPRTARAERLLRRLDQAVRPSGPHRREG